MPQPVTSLPVDLHHYCAALRRTLARLVERQLYSQTEDEDLIAEAIDLLCEDTGRREEEEFHLYVELASVCDNLASEMEGRVVSDPRTFEMLTRRHIIMDRLRALEHLGSGGEAWQARTR